MRHLVALSLLVAMATMAHATTARTYFNSMLYRLQVGGRIDAPLPGERQTVREEDRCGLGVIPEVRIIGGFRAPQCQWPFTPLVALRFFFPTDSSPLGNLTFCSGGLVDSRTVITSAFCMLPFTQPDYANQAPHVRVMVGDLDARKTDYDPTTGQPEDRIPMEGFKIHPEYNKLSYDNNIAVIRLSRPVVFNQCKLPACLPPAPSSSSEQSCHSVDRSCIMAGWGSYADVADGPYMVPLYSNITLYDAALTEEISRVSKTQVPVGSLIGRPPNPNHKACVFDWGGIVTCKRSSGWELNGLIGVQNCQYEGDPPVFVTDVSRYRTFIDRCRQNINTC